MGFRSEPPQCATEAVIREERSSSHNAVISHRLGKSTVTGDGVSSLKTTRKPLKENKAMAQNPFDNLEDSSKELQQTQFVVHEPSSSPHDSMVTIRSPGLRASVSIETPIMTVTEPLGLLEKGCEKINKYSLDTRSRPVESNEDGNEPISPRDSTSTTTRHSVLRTEPMDPARVKTLEELNHAEETNVPANMASDNPNALLLARLEEENKMLATNPKSAIARSTLVAEQEQRKQPILPSIPNPQNLAQRSPPVTLRYSKIPPPPMTELEFWGALVKDSKMTAKRLPTLMSKKIRCGVPAPLRGVVWQSLTGARDPDLGNQYDILCGQPSSYDSIIGKDLGRSFPGVELFRDPNGEGQKMLGRVLKCFSLYDENIGYCQGLAFIVGPLLMHMGDQQAFCVLVRLMENYDMRSCFLPDLSGLHVRIYQFRQLLRQHIPNLSRHLDSLQIEPAYVSQWFLTFFAVNCPLPLLFRMYDVIFAEGASNTIFRVALSLMRKNEQKIMSYTELEDVMQLLLSRGLWDVYHYNADEFVNDFVSHSNIINTESLQALEMSFKEAQATDSLSHSTKVDSTVSQLSGRTWVGPDARMKSTNSGLAAPSQPMNLIRRSSSKHSIASTLNSIEGSGTDSTMSFSTGATSLSRDSSNTDMSSIMTQSVSFNQANKTNKDLHSQIEDLLTALSELQRENAIVAAQLQKEREERDDDRMMVQTLLDRFKNTSYFESPSENTESFNPLSPIELGTSSDSISKPQTQPSNEDEIPEIQISALLRTVELRFSPRSKRPSSLLQTKSQLREDLFRAKEQLVIEKSKTQDFCSKLSEKEQEITNLQEQVRKENQNFRLAENENQKLERQVKDLRKELLTNNRDNSAPTGSGLRELKLGRPNSRHFQSSVHSKRVSSLNAFNVTSHLNAPNRIAESHPSTVNHAVVRASDVGKENESEALIIELVQAKTAEATARQEADELRNRLDSLRKLIDAPISNFAKPTQSMSSGFSSYFSSSKAEEKPPAPSSAPIAPMVPSVSSVTGFLGGWGKRAIGSPFGG